MFKVIMNHHPTCIRSRETHWDHFRDDLSKTKALMGYPNKRLLKFHFNVEFLTITPPALGVEKHIGTTFETIWARQRHLMGTPSKKLLKFILTSDFNSGSCSRSSWTITPPALGVEKFIGTTFVTIWARQKALIGYPIKKVAKISF